MTNIIFIVYVVVFACVSLIFLLIEKNEKEFKKRSIVVLIGMILISCCAFYQDYVDKKSYYNNFIDEYTVAKVIIEAEIQNKTIFADNDQLVNKAIEYNIKLVTMQSKAQRKLTAIPKEIMSFEPIQIHKDYDIKWVIE